VDRLTVLPPKLLGDPESNESAEPTPQLGRLAQFRELFPGRNERLLSEVFALAHAARCGIGKRTDQRLVPFNDLAEGIVVPLETFSHQFGIVLSGRLHVFECYHIRPYAPGKGLEVTGSRIKLWCKGLYSAFIERRASG
jgi:hypothetical protein